MGINHLICLLFLTLLVKLVKFCERDLIILESTSPVGTSDQIQKYLSDQGHSDSDFSIAYCPERVLPGNIIEEFQTTIE